MGEEEMQRKMELIVNQQAQFAADIQQLREAQNELTTKHSKLSDAVIAVVGIVGTLAESQERMAKEIAESQKRADAKLVEMGRAHAETDERLNLFINVVERYISERRNGQNGRARED
jgi:peptidoglycan hydrolase CwlO-like protein